jgi:hypothetical protein
MQLITGVKREATVIRYRAETVEKGVVMEPHEEQEGWFTDPFGRHEARWLSFGTPTKLVRDDGVESYDEPPEEEEPSLTPERIPEVQLQNGADLIRAGESGGMSDLGSLDRRMEDEALEGLVHPQISPGGSGAAGSS